MEEIKLHSSNQKAPVKGIPIGVIGPRETARKIMRVLQAFPSFHGIAREYALEQEAPRLAAQLASEVEVIVVSGPTPYRLIREETELGVPVHFVPLTETDFYRALFRIQKKLGSLDNVALSVDSISKQTIKALLKDADAERLSVLHYDGQAFAPVDQLISFHAGQYEAGASLGALTADPLVAAALDRLGIPCEWAAPTDQNITVTLERALLSTETRQLKEAQIVVGMLNVDAFTRLIQNRSSEHDIQKFKLEIHRILLDYVESLDGYLTHLGADEYLFFTTRGIFERETGGYKSIPLAKYASSSLGLTLSMGIGFGRSANEAGTHARSALRRSKEAGGNTCFIVREDRTLIGPLEMAEPVEYDLSITNGELLKRTEDAGMTSGYLSRLLSHVARTGSLEYKVHDLAAILDITIRSTHRLLLQWMDYGLIEIAGFEKVPKGRPRQIYRLTFLAETIGRE